jgi:hypothetical protein
MLISDNSSRLFDLPSGHAPDREYAAENAGAEEHDGHTKQEILGIDHHLRRLESSAAMAQKIPLRTLRKHTTPVNVFVKDGGDKATINKATRPARVHMTAASRLNQSLIVSTKPERTILTRE